MTDAIVVSTPTTSKKRIWDEKPKARKEQYIRNLTLREREPLLILDSGKRTPILCLFDESTDQRRCRRSGILQLVIACH